VFIPVNIGVNMGVDSLWAAEMGARDGVKEDERSRSEG
jgi:hypothetical protein